MKIGEAKQIYGGQIREYQEQKLLLSKQKRELEKKIEATENGRNRFADEAATLELTIDAVNKKQTEYQDYMSALTEQWAAKANMVSGRSHGRVCRGSWQDHGSGKAYYEGRHRTCFR